MTGKNYLQLVAVGAAAVIGMSAKAHATDYTWNKATGSNLHWNTATQDNWGTGVGGAFPNAATDKAIIFTDIAADMGISLQQNITLGALDIGDSAPAIATVEYQINNGSGGPWTLTFQAPTVGGTATINLLAGTGATAPTHVVNAAAQLGADTNLDINVLGAQGLSFAGGLNIGSGRVLIGGSGAGGVNFTGDLLGTASSVVTKNNSAAMSVGNSLKSFQGTLQMNRGSMSMVSASMANAANLEINGAMSLNTGTTNPGGSVVVGSTGSTTTNNPGQRLPSARVTMNSGVLTHNGQFATGTTWTGQAVQDDVTTFDFNSGFSFVSMGRGANTTETVLNIATLERGAGATAYIRGLNTGNLLGTETKFKFANGASFVVGDAAGASATELVIIPWIATRSANSSTANPEGLTTWTAASGVRVLASSEYNASISAGSTHNVKVATADLGGVDRQVNSFTGTWFNASNFGAGRTLTVKSGVVFFGQGNTQIGTAGSANSGTLAFGAAEGVFWQSGGGTNQVHANMTGTNGFTKAGTGLLTLTGDNSGMSGAVHVSSGTLRVGNGTQSSSVGTGDVTVHNGAILQLSSHGSIADNADVFIDAYGVFSGKIELDATMVEIVGSLTIGGVEMADGTYGSLASAAQFKDDTYFAGTGVMYVPEPASLSLLAMGALCLLKRRHRA